MDIYRIAFSTLNILAAMILVIAALLSGKWQVTVLIIIGVLLIYVAFMIGIKGAIRDRR